ncbi:MAG TPA: hypothetical protein PLJ78_17330 [Anaerolineae bacterium]|nr:hypothetical protein [Anaerolineae bacterium]HQK15693.1 hypothetical protein [Anaerolineae bacterium]
MRRVLLAFIALVIATGVWLPSMPLLFRPDLDDHVVAESISPATRTLAARHLALWSDPALREVESAKLKIQVFDAQVDTFHVGFLGAGGVVLDAQHIAYPVEQFLRRLCHFQPRIA